MKLRRLALNSAQALGRVLIGAALNASADAPTIADDQDGWLQIAPFGEVPYFHEEKGGWKKYSQVFKKDQADKMVAAFNALSAKKGDRFRGLPIYAGHPDGNPTRWPDESRLGGIMDLQARQDGLYAKCAWNDRGEQNRTQGYLVYPSPAWLYDTRAAKQTGIILPDELRSVGLTNSPRIHDSIPWVNSDDPGAPEGAAASSSSSSQSDANNPTTMIDHKKMLTDVLGLPDDASDDDIKTAHGKHMDVKAAADKLQKAHDKLDKAAQGHAAAIDKLQAQTTAANQARDAAQADAAKFRAVAANTLLDQAINAGRITAAERPVLATAFNTDFDAATATLAGRKSALNTQALGLRPNGDDLSTPAMRQYAYNCRADELKRELKLVTEDEISQAMRADAKGKTIIAAMEAAAK